MKRGDRTQKKQVWVMPSWMKPYREMISNTGGNPIEELMNDHASNVRTNVVRAALCLCVKSQVALLERLRLNGFLKDTPFEFKK